MASIMVQFQKKAPVSYHEIALSMLAAALCTACCAALLIPVFPHIQDSWIVYAVCGGVIAAAFCLLMFLRFGKWAVIIISSLVLALFLIRYAAFRNGILTLANDFLTFLTGKTGRIHSQFRTDGETGIVLVQTLYMFLIALISASLMQKKRVVFPVILLVVSAAACICGLPASPCSTILSAAAATVSILSFRRDASAVRSPGYSVFSSLLPAGIALALATVLPIIAAALAGGSAFSTEAAADGIRHTLHTMRYEPEGDTGMPEGNLHCKRYPMEEDTPMYLLSMSHPEKLYLRGFTADTYENSMWSQADSETYIENASLFYTLHTDGFYGQSMIAAAAAAVNALPEKEETLILTPVNCCLKYRCLPYALSDSGVLDPEMIGDAGALNHNTPGNARASYTISYIPGSLPEWYELDLSLANALDNPAVSDHLRLEQAYYNYTLDADRQLSEDAAYFCAALFGTEPTDRTLSEILTLVQKTLDENFTCEKSDTYRAEATPANDQDALVEFAESKRGTPAHLATAATVMLRYLGVPARYVEGYLLTADKAAACQPEEEIILTASDAHAWSEFYLRGIGWVPFEAVPGYMDNEEISRITTLAENSRFAAGSSPLYAQTEIVYTSGVQKPAPPERPQIHFHFTWKKEYLWYILGGALEFALILFVTTALLARARHRKAMNKIRSAADSGRYDLAVSLEFGYASRLMRETGITDLPGLTKLKLLNEEARFSAHSLNGKDFREAEAFTRQVIQCCRKTWTAKERFRNYWFRGII